MRFRCIHVARCNPPPPPPPPRPSSPGPRHHPQPRHPAWKVHRASASQRRVSDVACERCCGREVALTRGNALAGYLVSVDSYMNLQVPS